MATEKKEQSKQSNGACRAFARAARRALAAVFRALCFLRPTQEEIQGKEAQMIECLQDHIERKNSSISWFLQIV